MAEALLRVGQRARTIGRPLRRGQAQPVHELAQRARRQRCIGRDDEVDHRVHARADLRAVAHYRPRLACGVHARAGVASRHAQQSAVVHAVEQLGAGVARAAEPVGHLAVLEMRVDLARVHGAAFAHECQHRVGLVARGLRPARPRLARMHQRVMLGAQKPVVDEEILLDAQRRVLAFEIAGDVAGHAMAQRQILRTSRRAQRIGLHEPQARQRPRQRGGGKQAARDGVAAQLIQRRCHGEILPKSPSDQPSQANGASSARQLVQPVCVA